MEVRGRYALLCVSCLGVLAFAQRASAQIETVTVTAEKRAENIQDVPMSVSAISGEELERNNITSFEDLKAFIPSLDIIPGNTRQNSTIVIRNIGTSGQNPGVDQDVGVFVDGAYIPVAAPVFTELSDISDIEVLRGPQGTLYGRNTPVGAVIINTRAPTQDTTGMVDAQYGNYDERRIMGYFGGGIADDIAGRVSFWSDTRSGYEYNLYDGQWVNNEDQYGGRGRIRWTPDANTTVDFVSYFSQISDDGRYGAQLNPYGPGGLIGGYCVGAGTTAAGTSSSACTAANSYNAANHDALNYQNALAWQSTATSGGTVNSAGTVTSSGTGLVGPSTVQHPFIAQGPWQVDAAEPDFDQTQIWGASLSANRSVPFLDATVTNILAYNSYADRDNNGVDLPADVYDDRHHNGSSTASDELRIASSTANFIDYVGGIYLYHEDTIADEAITLGPGANGYIAGTKKKPSGYFNDGDELATAYEAATNSIAGYGQATMHITDDFRLTGGLRYGYDWKHGFIEANCLNALTLNNGTATAGQSSPAFAKASCSSPANAATLINPARLSWLYGAQYDIRKHVMAYVTISTGVKDGGFNGRPGGANASNLFTFGPETSDNYEVGVKSILFDNMLLLNADVYRMLVHNFQAVVPNANGGGSIVQNAGNVREQGVEADLQAHPVEYLTLNGTLTYSDAIQYGAITQALECVNNYPVAGAPPPPGTAPLTSPGAVTCNYDGMRTADAPKWRSSALARWEQPWHNSHYDWFIQGDVKFQSSEWLQQDLDPRSLQKTYQLFDAMFGIEPESGNWRVDFWGKNLANKLYYIAKSPQPTGNAGYFSILSAPNAASATSPGPLPNGYIGYYGDPRTFGVEAAWKF